MIFGGGFLAPYALGTNLALQARDELSMWGSPISFLGMIWWATGMCALACLPFLCPTCKGRLRKSREKTVHCPTCGNTED